MQRFAPANPESFAAWALADAANAADRGLFAQTVRVQGKKRTHSGLFLAALPSEGRLPSENRLYGQVILRLDGITAAEEMKDIEPCRRALPAFRWAQALHKQEPSGVRWLGRRVRMKADDGTRPYGTIKFVGMAHAADGPHLRFHLIGEDGRLHVGLPSVAENLLL